MKNFLQSMVQTYKKKVIKSDERETLKKYQCLTYPQCTLGGQHENELMNLVCLEKDCPQNQLLFCCICQNTFHNGHQVKPLKLLLIEYDSYIREQQKSALKPGDKEILCTKVNEQEEKIQEIFNGFKKTIEQKLVLIQQGLREYYESLRKTIRQREDPVGDQLILISNIINNHNNIQKLEQSIRELLKEVTIDDNQTSDINSQELQQIIDYQLKEQVTYLQELEKKISEQLQEEYEDLKQKNIKSLFQKNKSFEFLPQNKHQQLEIVNPKTVKSSNNGHGYKFAVMVPELNCLSQTSFAFKLNNVHQSNWIAVGICQLQIVQAKQFGFAFSSTGHGAYMISSNGGSWSSTNATQNNVVKCFKFGKGDTILCDYNPKSHSIIFTKANSTQTYKLDVPKSDKKLYPCVLFYYALDEVEFIPM